jgi:predicted amidohydrolase YtcJ
MIERIFRVTLLLSIFLCFVVSPVFAAHIDKYADVILYNGKIITVDKDFSIVDAVAIKDGKFIAVGKKGEVMGFAGKNTQKIDLKHKVVIPGLNDSHTHMLSAGTSLPLIQLLDCTNLACVLQRIGAKANSLNPGQWVIASSQWHEGELVEKRLPNRYELDSVSPNNPVYLPRGGHTLVVNSLALQMANLTKDTPDPPGGLYIRDPVTGELTGLMFDNAKAPINALLPKTTYQDKINGLKAICKEYNRLGITSVTEPSPNYSPGSEEIRAYMELWSKGELTVRTGLLIGGVGLDFNKNPYYQGFGDDVFRIAGIKVVMDGGIETAWMKDRYLVFGLQQPNPNFYGVQVTPTDVFKNVCLAAAQNGWQVRTHGVGDQAIETIINTYEWVNSQVPIKDLRWTVEHCFLPTQESLDKMKSMGILIPVQDHPVLLGSNMVNYWGEERANASYPLRKFIDQGFTLGGGTDSPVLPWNPFLSMWWMVTRDTLVAGILGPDQKITRQEALQLYTIGSAHMTSEEEIKGSIEVGKLADLVILDKDILTIPEDEIKNILPVATILGGEFVYQAQ